MTLIVELQYSLSQGVARIERNLVFKRVRVITKELVPVETA